MRTLLPFTLIACGAPAQEHAQLHLLDVATHTLDLVEASPTTRGLAPTILDIVIHQGDDPCEPGDGRVAARAMHLEAQDFPLRLTDSRFEDQNNGVTLEGGTLIGVWGSRRDLFGTTTMHPAWIVTYAPDDPASVQTMQDCANR